MNFRSTLFLTDFKRAPLTILLMFLSFAGCSKDEKEETVSVDTRTYRNFFPNWSGDLGKITFVSDRTGDWEIFVMDSSGKNLKQITHSPGRDTHPVWSENNRIYFYTDRDGNKEIYSMNSDGSDPVNITNSPANEDVFSISPDGKSIAFYSDRDGNGEVYISDIDGSNAKNLTKHPARDRWPCWSNDGESITFSSNRGHTKDTNLYSIDLSTMMIVQLTDLKGDNYDPEYSPDGKHLLFTHSLPETNISDIVILDVETNRATNLTNGRNQELEATWLSGEIIGFASVKDETWNISIMNRQGEIVKTF